MLLKLLQSLRNPPTLRFRARKFVDDILDAFVVGVGVIEGLAAIDLLCLAGQVAEGVVALAGGVTEWVGIALGIAGQVVGGGDAAIKGVAGYAVYCGSQALGHQATSQAA